LAAAGVAAESTGRRISKTQEAMGQVWIIDAGTDAARATAVS
jgi:hypothetical protein